MIIAPCAKINPFGLRQRMNFVRYRSLAVRKQNKADITIAKEVNAWFLRRL